MDIEILELCKENIQPLRKGRKASSLGLALQAEVNVELQEKLHKEREDFELAIVTYDGEDPLQPRYEYVNWLEQMCIKRGRECNLVPLLEDTIIMFKDDERYKQDHRFTELIVKYIETQEKPLELFQMVYCQGVGTMCAVLYKAWAEVLDRLEDYKRADQIYQLGLTNRAEPVQMLKEAHAQFQLSIGRRMMLSGGELTSRSAEETDESSRLALGKLKNKPGSFRHAQGAPGVLTTRAHRQQSSSSKTLSVFTDDENNYDHLINAAMQKNKLGSIATSDKNSEENRIKAGKWNKGYNRKEMAKIPSVPATPSFKVLADPGAELETPKPAATPCNVLKTRKAELLSNAMDVFTNSQSARKPLQANLEVYAGGREFSFEELRAAYYRKREDHRRAKNKCEGPDKDWDLDTPLRNTVSNVSFTPLCRNSKILDFETPVVNKNEFVNCTPSEEHITQPNFKLNCQEENDEITKVSDCFEKFDINSYQTPAKICKDFFPITPSLKGIDLSEFATPQEENPEKIWKTPGKFANITPSHNDVKKESENDFTIFTDCDEDIPQRSTDQTPIVPKFGKIKIDRGLTNRKNDFLPTIDENQESGNDNTIEEVAIKPPKKQLFSEPATAPASRKVPFEIFTDED